mgnify:CR=1 FL=1
MVLKIALKLKSESGFSRVWNSCSELDFPFKLANE